MKNIISAIKRHKFLFEELVKRDFKRKYKRTVLGMAWSILSPLLTLLVMRLVFDVFFGRTIPNYTIYLFCGTLLFHYYREATASGMGSLLSNAGIFTKINVPKYIFLLSRNVSALFNFLLTLILFFGFCIADNIDFHWGFFSLIYPIVTLMILNLGLGLILSALYVFFRDIQYLYDVFSLLLMYMSAIFYSVEPFPPLYQKCFLLNPVYVHIAYFRQVVLKGTLPGWQLHALCGGYALLALLIGSLIYKKCNREFIYYV